MKKLIILCCSALICLGLVACTNSPTQESEEQTVEKDYTNTLFDDSVVHKINIEISEEDWQDLKTNPLDKTKYTANVTIDGETIENVTFATKGNTSLSSVASNEDSDRYSFKINFGKNVKGQTYYGLDKLNLNNIYADTTYMKDYLAYELMEQMGVASPMTSFVSLSINGETFGLYLAIEEIGDSFLARNYGEDAGELYKPESEQLANVGGNKMDMELPEGMQMPSDGNFDPSQIQLPDGMQMPNNGQQIPGGQTQMPTDGNFDPSQMQRPEGLQMPTDGNQDQFARGGFGGGMSGFSDSSTALTYIDDNIESYSYIFDNAETDATEEDQLRLIESLKKLSEGTDLDDILDVEALINYFVAHNFTVNGDSYTGSMLHNYYLYEKDGQMTMLPWDYNLAFGGFSMGQMNQTTSQSTSVINSGIASLINNTEDSTRPMWNAIISNEEYYNQYLERYDDLITSYFESGEFEKEIDRIYEMIKPYVENDPSAFYTLDEFEKGVSTLKQFCLLRSESIRKQLNGEISTVTSTQDSSTLVDGSSVDLNSMGTQNNNQMQNTIRNNQ